MDGPGKSRLEGVMEAAETIRYCVQHQRRIIDDVLTLSKLDADLISIHPTPVQPVQLVKRASQIFDNELKKADVTLEILESDSLTGLNIDWLLLDHNRFLQVLINLVANAIKFTKTCDRRQISIKVHATEKIPSISSDPIKYFPRVKKSDGTEEPFMGYLTVEVQDTGIGMQENEMKALFQQFAQASPKTSIKYGGTGKRRCIFLNTVASFSRFVFLE